MTTSRAATAREKLERQTRGDYGIGNIGSPYQAVDPAAAMYGVFGPQYAAALAAPTDSAAEHALNVMALRNNSADEAARYDAQLIAAQEAQLKGEDTRGYYGLQRALIDNAADPLPGEYSIGKQDDGRYGFIADPVIQGVNRQQVMHGQNADAFKDRASGIADLAEKGYRIPNMAVGGMLRSPTNPENIPVEYGLTPAQETERFRVENRLDEGLTAEQQIQVAELRAAASEKQLEGSVEINPNTGTPFFKVKGPPDQVQRWYEERGANPQTGEPLNPKAGASGGNAPAKTSAYTPSDGEMKAIVQLVHPGTNVTGVSRSQKRNDALYNGQRRGSYHIRGYKPGTMAIDAAPRRDMTFEQYVEGYRRRGFTVVEAKDESGQARTKGGRGPHWHVALAGFEAPNRQARPITQPTRHGTPNVTSVVAQRLQQRGAKTEVQGDKITATLPNGEVRVYQGGRRVQ